MVTVDYYSNFYELDKLPDTKSSTVIRKTKQPFARYGITEELVSDNGPQYISTEFATFSKVWDFEHLTISPYKSKANGKVEAAVKIAKQLLRKCKKSNSDIHLTLLHQRNKEAQIKHNT